MTDNWGKKDLWIKKSKHFAIEISRHTVETDYAFDTTGPNRWCVYAYIYTSHPLFNEFAGTYIYQKAVENMPFHGGCSYLKYHYSKTLEIITVQVGADYNHIDDDCYSYYDTKEDASRVFYDADQLFNFLHEATKETVT